MKRAPGAEFKKLFKKCFYWCMVTIMKARVRWSIKAIVLNSYLRLFDMSGPETLRCFILFTSIYLTSVVLFQARLIIASVLSPIIIVIGSLLARDYNESKSLIFRTVGANTKLQNICNTLFMFMGILKGDLQVSVWNIYLFIRRCGAVGRMSDSQSVSRHFELNQGSRCFLEQETLSSFLSKGWFQERTQSQKCLFHNRILIN